MTLAGGRAVRRAGHGKELLCPGVAALGVAPSGALDRAAARTANRLVGNPEDAAVIESVLVGFTNII